MKKWGVIVLGFGVVGGAAIGGFSMTGLGSDLHAWSHKAGLCSGGESCARPGTVTASGAVQCARPEVDTAILDSYSEDEIKVVRYFAGDIIADGDIDFSEEDVRRMEQATGVSLAVLMDQGMSESRIQLGVLAELKRKKFNIDSLLGAGNCARFSACSIDRDLSGASQAELARYEAEKAEDGQSFETWMAPDFTLPRTTGGTVSLSDYRGHEVALVFLAGHCNHSLQTLPVLARLHEQFASSGLKILPVYINSGSIDNVRTWSSSLNLDLPLLVAGDKALSLAYDFRMVPTTFLIDAQGRVTRKLVGQKDEKALHEALNELVAS